MKHPRSRAILVLIAALSLFACLFFPAAPAESSEATEPFARAAPIGPLVMQNAANATEAYQQYMDKEIYYSLDIPRCFDWLEVNGDLLFGCKNNSKVFLLKADGEITATDLDQHCVYYVANDTLYRYHPSSKTLETLCNAHGARCVSALSNYVVILSIPKPYVDLSDDCASPFVSLYYDYKTGEVSPTKSQHVKAALAAYDEAMRLDSEKSSGLAAAPTTPRPFCRIRRP